jgi:hypothetical protein
LRGRLSRLGAGGKVHPANDPAKCVKAEQPTRPERSNLPLVPPETDNFLADVALETACRCSRWPFPHLHSREDRERAIREWNRDSRHKVERIQ